VLQEPGPPPQGGRAAAAAATEDLHCQVGVAGAVGIDLAPAPPLVVRGDFHAQPFPDATFDFEFSNVFNHALYSDRFAAEIERTLRPGGVAVLHELKESCRKMPKRRPDLGPAVQACHKR